MIVTDSVYVCLLNAHRYKKNQQSWGDAFVNILKKEQGHNRTQIIFLERASQYKYVSNLMDKYCHVVVSKGLITDVARGKVLDMFVLPELTDIVVTIIGDVYYSNYTIQRLMEYYEKKKLISILSHGLPNEDMMTSEGIMHVLAKNYASKKSLSDIIDMRDKLIESLIPIPTVLRCEILGASTDYSYEDDMCYDTSNMDQLLLGW